MTIEERQKQILENMAKRQEIKQMAMLDTDAGMSDYAVTTDKDLLQSIIDRIAVAYDSPVMTGYKFSENVEMVIAIVNKLQFANKKMREALEPSTNQINLYKLFDRDIREGLLEAYGQLPYARELTTLTLPDGKVEILDQDIVDQAREGIPADITKFNFVLSKVGFKLGLYADYVTSQQQEDVAFAHAKKKLITVEKLAEYQKQIEEA